MTKEFEFIDQGHRFFCSVEAPQHSGMQPWWWFRLDEVKSTRYAPFEASSKDTKESVQQRIIAYYAELLAIQARPVHPRPVWRKPVIAPATPEIASTEAPPVSSSV